MFDNAGQLILDKFHLYSCLLLRRDQENYPYSNSRDIADIEFVVVVVGGKVIFMSYPTFVMLG